MAINNENAAPLSANVMVSAPLVPSKFNAQAYSFPLLREKIVVESGKENATLPDRVSMNCSADVKGVHKDVPIAKIPIPLQEICCTQDRENAISKPLLADCEAKVTAPYQNDIEIDNQIVDEVVPEHQTLPQFDQEDNVQEGQSEATLEEYKKIIDATTHGIDDDEVPTLAQHRVEWKDLATGTIMGYSTCEESVAEDVGDTDEWEDPNAGAVMSYACDEASDVEDDVEWEDPHTGVKMNYAYDEEGDFDRDACEAREGTLDDWTVAEINIDSHCIVEWEDPCTGAKMNYAYDDDLAFDHQSDEQADDDEHWTSSSIETHHSHCITEWEDPHTGTKMNYSYDVDSAFEDIDDSESSDDSSSSQLDLMVTGKKRKACKTGTGKCGAFFRRVKAKMQKDCR